MPDGPATRTTSRDVARKAAVSRSAVSLVLSNKWHGRVSPATAERIRAAAAGLGYQPNLVARSLRLERTGTILLVVPTLTNPIFGYIHAGVARAAAERDTAVVVAPLEADESEQPLPLVRQALDGLIVCSLGDDRRLPDLWGGLPQVNIDRDPARSAHVVNAHVGDGMSQLARHLLGLGHRHIGYLHSARKAWTFGTRARALRRHAQAYGATLSLAATSFEFRTAQETALRLLGAQPRPTALICEDDNLAVAAYGAARKLALRIPQDLSVTGFNDLPIVQVLDPALTTVRIPAEQLGRTAVEHLMRVMDGEESGRERLPTALIIRESTASPPAPTRARRGR